MSVGGSSLSWAPHEDPDCKNTLLPNFLFYLEILFRQKRCKTWSDLKFR